MPRVHTTLHRILTSPVTLVCLAVVALLGALLYANSALFSEWVALDTMRPSPEATRWLARARRHWTWAGCLFLAAVGMVTAAVVRHRRRRPSA